MPFEKVPFALKSSEELFNAAAGKAFSKGNIPPPSFFYFIYCRKISKLYFKKNIIKTKEGRLGESYEKALPAAMNKSLKNFYSCKELFRSFPLTSPPE